MVRDPHDVVYWRGLRFGARGARQARTRGSSATIARCANSDAVMEMQRDHSQKTQLRFLSECFCTALPDNGVVRIGQPELSAGPSEDGRSADRATSRRIPAVADYRHHSPLRPDSKALLEGVLLVLNHKNAMHPG